MTRTPLDTAHEMLNALAARDRDRWEAVVAEDASLIIPYTPEGPTRFDGRASFADLTWNFFRSWKTFAWHDVELHIAQDDPGYIRHRTFVSQRGRSKLQQPILLYFQNKGRVGGGV